MPYPSAPHRRWLLPARLAGLVVAGFASLMLQGGTAEAADPAPAPPAQAKQATSKASDTAESAGARYRVTSTEGAALRLHEKPGLDSAIVTRLPEGTFVTLLDGAAVQKDDERWLRVKSDKLEGWAAARYLAREAALASILPTTAPTLPTLPKDAPFGNRVAAIAGAMLGQPYVWAGAKPGGFDCSGLVQWVFTQAGINMPRKIPEQLAMGNAITRETLDIGDLIAFANTYTPGLSHVGIFIGSGRFVHAADESQGVIISSLDDKYWSQHYYGAVRIRPPK